ncbi:MAG: polyketide synthase [Burkholderiales bacterium RIFCSPLOWO2_02_FULL_57_36]|nr:MAG: polyketide synthase [Burkholderiales bacterium RIFCSPLOWO2_02_FULL_57_36]
MENRTSADISVWMSDYLARQLSIARNAVDVRRSFDQYGIDSASALQMVGDLEDYLGHELSPSLPYQYPTIESLSDALANMANP